MNARELRKSLGARYRQDEESGVLAAPDAAPFDYSDGAASEAYIAQAMREAKDRAVGSEDLARRIRDWPSRYHLSPARQNLLRPILGSVRGLVVEVGAGCGAITRQLGETGATVLAIEGSLARARIAAMRCQDLPNVVVVCDNFANVQIPAPADLVTLIGVLEYSRMFMPGEDPVQEMLTRAARALAEEGLLALAIENQLGVKYLAGAREDHTGLPFFGVSDRYGPKMPVTFGEGELRGRLNAAGFGVLQCLYPFPDYKLPSVLVTESGFADPRLNVADLIATSMGRRDPVLEGVLAYPESLARNVFIRNGLGAATANSFLFLAGRGDGASARMPAAKVMAFAYSTARARAFAKETRTLASADGFVVERQALYKAAAAAAGSVRQRISDEGYASGTILYRGLEAIMARPGWSVQDVVEWARPYRDLLLGLATPGEGIAPADRTLPPDHLDCTPFNVVRCSRDGALVPIDLEWEWTGRDPLTVGRVAFRGLWNSFVRVEDVAEAAGGTPTDLYALVQKVMEGLGLPVDEARALGWIQGEYEFVNEVSAAGETVPSMVPHLAVGAAVATLPRVASGLGGAEGLAAGFNVQAYFHAAGEPFAEERSVSVPASGSGARIVAHLPLPARQAGYERIRVDPMDIPGLFRLERVALLSASGELVWESRTCRAPDLSGVQHMRDMSALAGSASGAIYFSEGIDPHFELSIPAGAMARIREGGALLVEIARLDAAELSAIVRLALLAATPRSPGR
jgi:precorrin-6B methylase 2